MAMQTTTGANKGPESTRSNISSALWVAKERGDTEAEVDISLERNQDANTIELPGVAIQDRLAMSRIVGGKLDLTDESALQQLDSDIRIKSIDPSQQQTTGPVF